MPVSLASTLKRRIFKAGGWTVLGQLLNQVLRLGGNLVLTRLLFPEAFGLMAIVQSVMVGITLLSDIGITPSIVQHKRGGEPEFFNTAWTIQVLRGFLIWLIVLLSAKPVAVFYGQPLLVSLLAAAGLVAIIGGFNSTKLALADRNITAGRVVAIELGTYAAGLLTTVVWAWITRSIWALVWGNVIAALAKALASHILLEGQSNQFRLERDAASSVFSFGKWILLSSALTFLVGEGNRLVIAALVSVSTLAFFTLATAMNRTVLQMIQQVGGRVMFAAYAEIERNRPKELYKVLRKGRLVLLVPAWLSSLFFVVFGKPLMALLYDARYVESGSMLQILAMGSLAWSVWASYEGILLAKGKVRTLTVVLIVESVLQLGGILIGGYWFGTKGITIAIAAGYWLLYPVLAWVYAQHSLWQPEIDLPFLAASALVIGMVLF